VISSENPSVQAAKTEEEVMPVQFPPAAPEETPVAKAARPPMAGVAPAVTLVAQVEWRAKAAQEVPAVREEVQRVTTLPNRMR
jgi:hypothetical protein